MFLVVQVVQVSRPRSLDLHHQKLLNVTENTSVSPENRLDPARVDALFLAWCAAAGVVVYAPDTNERALLSAPSIEPGSDVHDTEPRP